ncbi:MAG: LON peptidase substrate-binding domain-containing protein [Rubrivivax sp.]|nr:LON peptidase substrate-binding domain-containing protein [Rubrivivax sp.]
MSAAALPSPLPLFPLQMVLFPGAVLGLRVFEARYLDLMSDCMRTRQPFGVVCLKAGFEAGRSDQPVQVEDVGVLAQLDEVDAEEAGILQVRCLGGERFRLQQPPTQRDNGLWVAQAETIPPDPLRLPGPAVLPTVTALAEAIRKLQASDAVPFAPPYQLDNAGWVANRWCELLPIPLAAKQKLMALEDPVIRLSLVDGYLRDKKVVVG